MSEYQYYEFRAVDRPLTSREMGELRALSTRAEITPTSFTNEYHFGDFRGSPEKLMHKYFDAFVYVANWGTHRLMLRLPRDLLDERTVKPYLLDPGMTADAKGDHVVLEFRSDDESGEWVEEAERFMADLLPVRESLLSGDLRALYIGWLAAVQYDGAYGGGYDEYGGGEADDDDDGTEDSEDDDRPEPPVPPAMQSLTAPLKALADFLRVDKDLLATAAEAGGRVAPSGPSREDLLGWVRGLEGRTKDDLLLHVMEGDVVSARRELLSRFRRERPAAVPKGGESGRTVGQLLAAARRRAAERRKAEAERKAREKARREREAAAAREKYLGSLVGREQQTWKQADDLILVKPPKYDEAVGLLKDLRDLAARSGGQAASNAFADRLAQLRDRYAKRPNLMKKLEQAGMGVPRSGA